MKKKPPATAPPRSLRLEWVDPKTLAENPANWRRHPARQVEPLRDLILGENGVGWAGALLYNERTQRLIDGHARRDLGSVEAPVLVGSWTEEQERLILATLDPLAALAEPDTAALSKLLEELETSTAGSVQTMLEELARSAAAAEPIIPETREQKEAKLQSEHFIEIYCSSEDLEEFRPSLEKWSVRRGVKVNIT